MEGAAFFRAAKSAAATLFVSGVLTGRADAPAGTCARRFVSPFVTCGVAAGAVATGFAGLTAAGVALVTGLVATGLAAADLATVPLATIGLACVLLAAVTAGLAATALVEAVLWEAALSATLATGAFAGVGRFAVATAFVLATALPLDDAAVFFEDAAVLPFAAGRVETAALALLFATVDEWDGVAGLAERALDRAAVLTFEVPRAVVRALDVFVDRGSALATCRLPAVTLLVAALPVVALLAAFVLLLAAEAALFNGSRTVCVDADALARDADLADLDAVAFVGPFAVAALAAGLRAGDPPRLAIRVVPGFTALVLAGMGRRTPYLTCRRQVPAHR